MKRKFLTLTLAALFLTLSAVQAKTIVLTGHDLTIEDALSIAKKEATVEISELAQKKVNDSYKLIFDAARAGTPIYGLTVGIGLNKDKAIFDKNGELSKELLEESQKFNQSLLRSHSGGLGESLPETTVRLSMVIRLNKLLNGYTGVQPYVVKLYAEMLNKGISPEIPCHGSIGEADILLASHIGAVMMGEWEAKVDGKVISGKKALEAKGLKPLVPIGKDGLGICSTNSVSEAAAIVALEKAKKVIKLSPTIYALSLEGLNGVVAPFIKESVAARGTEKLNDVANEVIKSLENSYLWQVNEKRALQDPLSFRTTIHGLAEAQKAADSLHDVITQQINSSDDNPVVWLDNFESSKSSQLASYSVNADKFGALIPTGNFESLPTSLAIERLSVALAHVSHNALQRILRISDDHFTGLPRYLAAPGNQGSAFAAISIPVLDRHISTMALSNPVSFLGTPITGDIEDVQANTLLASQRLEQISKNTLDILAIELFHSSQAIGIRKLSNPDLKLGTKTNELYEKYRKVVPFVNEDRIFTTDFRNSSCFLENFE